MKFADWTALKKRLHSISTWRYVIFCAAIGLCGYMAFSGLGTPLENMLRVERDSLSSRPASGDIEIIEIDAKSLQKLDQWPWPRQYHARLIDKLHQAKAARIAFDVDFSARSRAGGDAALAAALERAGGSVILPTMQQSASSQGSGSDRADRVESLPLPEFRDNVFLASVNVKADADGQVNNYLYGTVTAATPRPSLAAMLAGRQGRMESAFRIDQSINPATIPRHSFADIIDGTDALADAQGKSFIIGGTAIEMGDRYAIARFGVQPGVVIQALAAETLYQDRVNANVGPWYMLIFAVATTLLRLSWLRTRVLLRRAFFIAQISVIMAMPLLSENMGWGSFDIVPALAFMGLIFGANKAFDFMAALGQARLVDRDSHMPNLTAMLRAKPAVQEVTAAVLRIDNYADITSVLSADERGELMRLVAERIGMISAGSDIYRVDSTSLAWFVKGSDLEALPGRFDAAAAVLRGKIQMPRRSVTLKVNFGAATGQAADISALVTKADLAAKRAAQQGERWGWHDDRILDAAEEKLSVLLDLERALADGELFVAYQPKYALAANAVLGAEALVRWNHPDKGFVRPDQFIPVLESEGRIDEMTLYVMRRVIEDIERWNTRGRRLNIAVNVSAILLTDTAFVATALELIDAAAITPDQITLEITESAALATPEAAIATLEKFKALGTRISIDDYGTGQSTLSYLKQFPADEIKIDQAFVRSMQHVEADRIMVRSTIELAHALGFKVVAEGVEDAECLALLRSFDCDTIQGWHIGKPVPASEFEAAWLGALPDEAAGPRAAAG